MLYIIALIVFLMGVIVFIFFGGNKKNESKKNNENDKENENNELVGIKRNKKIETVPKKDIFDFMIIQNNGKTYSMVIQCKGINYDLMSDVEQLSIEEGFIVFLNTLKYPIQLYVQARTVDLRKSMGLYQQRVDYFEKQFNEAEENYKKIVNDFNSTDAEIAQARNNRERFANIFEYVEDINRYVGKLGTNKNILQRKFYIVISYNKSEINSNSSFSPEEIKEICRKELYTRAQSLISSLMSCSVVGKIMFSEELAELLYISYNRDDARIFDIREALDSGAFRMYSTAKDVYDKKREKLEEEIEKEAISRVQEAIRLTERSSKIKTQDEVEDEFEEETDKRAINIIREADLDRDTKEELTQVIAVNHVLKARENNEKRMERDARLKEEKNLKEDSNIEKNENEERNEEINTDKNDDEENETKKVETTDNIYEAYDDENDSIV